MNATWAQFAASLRSAEDSDIFARLVSHIGGTPALEETPDEWSDPEGRTRYFKFLYSGIEIGFRKNRLNHIHFFVSSRGEYAPYRGPLEEGVSRDHGEHRITEVFGKPDFSGGPKQSALLGAVRRWIKYKRAECSVRYEFEPGDGIAKVTLIAE